MFTLKYRALLFTIFNGNPVHVTILVIINYLFY